MMPPIHYQQLRYSAISFIFMFSILPTVPGADVPLTEIAIWSSLDSCAQSCAISASNAFSIKNACPDTDPASCICNVAPAVSNVAGKAHVCASNSCKPTNDPPRARLALTSYCLSNGIVTALVTTTGSSSSLVAGSSMMVQVPATTEASTITASSSMIQVNAKTEASSMNTRSLIPPSTVVSTASTSLSSPPTSTAVQAPTSSFNLGPTPGWIYTSTGRTITGSLIAIGAILITLSLCLIFRKYLRTWGLQLAIRLRLMKEWEGDEWTEGGQKDSCETDPGERSSLNGAQTNSRRSLHPQLLHVMTKTGQAHDCHAKLDSGADDNFISLSQLKRLGYDQKDLEPCDHVWNAFGDPNLKSVGSLELTWTTQNRTHPREPVTFYVLDAKFNELVLGQKFSFKEGLLVYNRTAWTVERNGKMSKGERDRLRREKEEEAAQSLARRNIQWIWEASTALYFYIDEQGRKIYQDQGGRSTANN